MISIDLFDYSEYRKIDIDVTKYINMNLAAIVRVVLDMLNDNGGFDLDGFFPRDYLDRKPEECRRLVDELYEILQSDILRDYIKPKYEYLLYSIISWWDDVADDESDLIPIKLDDELERRIKCEESYFSEDGENIVLMCITSYEEYYYICFLDFDFLPDQLSSMVTLYLQNPDMFKMINSDVDLEEYEDLMPCDLRELYKEKTIVNNKKGIEIQDIEQGIIFEILTAVQTLEMRVVEIAKRDEVEISNDIYSTLFRTLKVKFDLEITREMTIGRANKKIGETDLYIYQNGDTYRLDYAIIENKYIENFKSQYQQLLGYLNQNFKFGVTISINKKYILLEAVKNIKDKLIEIKESDMDYKITKIYTPYKEFPYVIKSVHFIPEDPSREMPIYHIILNLYDNKREKIAKTARNK